MNIVRELAFGGALAATLSALGCNASSEPPKTPTDRATEMARTRCGPDLDEKLLAPVLDGSAIKNVEPLYSNVEEARGGSQSELRGAIVNVQAIAGVTAEWLDRALECHSAQRVLGQNAQPGGPDDPFWLPGSVVDIDVRSAKDGFRVAVAGFTPRDAEQILSRAKAFAKSSPGPK